MGAYIALLLSVCLFTAISSQHLLAETPAEFKPDGNWLATVQKDIEAQEYRPSKQMVGIKGEKLTEPTWHITNRAHGLRSFVSKDGWEIIPRPASKSLDTSGTVLAKGGTGYFAGGNGGEGGAAASGIRDTKFI